jgi:hypothetical protein
VIQRRAAVAIVVTLSAALLAGCGFESPDVESTEHNSVQATDFTLGSIKVDDTSITAVTTSGVPNFYLIVTLVNTGRTSDSLTGATSTQGALTISSGQASLPPGLPVEFGLPVSGSSAPTISVNTSPMPQTGGYVPIVFTFTDAGTSPTIQVPVVPAGETTNATQPVPTATASVPTEVGQTASD